MLPQTSAPKSREQMEQDAIAKLAQELQEAKGADVYSLLIKALESVIPAITHVQCVLT